MKYFEDAPNQMSRRQFVCFTSLLSITALVGISSQRASAEEEEGGLPEIAAYEVHDRFEPTSVFGVGPTHSDSIHTWSRCKKTPGGGNANVYAYVIGEVFFYGADGTTEVQERKTQRFPSTGEWTHYGNPAIVMGSVSWNTAQWLNGSVGVVKKIVRKYTLYSRGTGGTTPIQDEPDMIESEHYVNPGT